MGNPRISTLIIGTIWVSFLAVVFGTFIAALTTNYSTAGFSQENDTGIFDKLDNLTAKANEYQEATKIDEKEGLLDIIGGYFSQAYQALKLTTNSLDVMWVMLNNAFSNANVNLGVAGSALRTAIITSLIIFIFIGVLISAIMKWKL